MKKYLSTVISSLTLLCLILSCALYEGPAETGRLAIILHFPQEGDNVSDNPGKTDESRGVESIDQVYCSIDKDGSEVYGAYLTLSGGEFTSGEIWLDAGSGYSVYVECFEGGIKSYTGFEDNITIQEDEVNTIDISLEVTIPQIPLNLHAEPVGDDEVKLVWIDIAVNEEGYIIERKTTGAYSEIGNVDEDVTEYYDGGLIPGTTYTYRIKAYNDAGVSAWSNTSHAVPGFFIPIPPGNLQANAISQTQIELNWDDNSNNELGFKLEKSVGDSNSFIHLADVNANIEDYTDSGLTPNTTYYYRIAAYNNGGNSTWSNTDDATTIITAGTEQDFPLGTSGLDITMVWIPPGSFMQGAYSGEQGAGSNEYPQHLVTLDYGFWIGKYEVTQAQWEAIMGDWNFNFDGYPNRPAEVVSWNDIVNDFLPALNNVTAGEPWRLPSESEWEYACRAGTDTRYYWGDDPEYAQIYNYAWYNDNSSNQTHEVGTKLPNAWGLYDMGGNVYELCEDYWHYDYNDAPTNGDPWLSPHMNSYRVMRGGSWSLYPYECRSANRNDKNPDHQNSVVGFRLVRDE